MRRIIQPLLKSYDAGDHPPPGWLEMTRGRIWNNTHGDEFIHFGFLTITESGTIRWSSNTGKYEWGAQLQLERFWEGKVYFEPTR